MISGLENESRPIILMCNSFYRTNPCTTCKIREIQLARCNKLTECSKLRCKRTRLSWRIANAFWRLASSSYLGLSPSGFVRKQKQPAQRRLTDGDPPSNLTLFVHIPEERWKSERRRSMVRKNTGWKPMLHCSPDRRAISQSGPGPIAVHLQ